MSIKYPRGLLKETGLLVDEREVRIEGQGLPHNDLRLIWLRYTVIPTELNIVVF